MKNWRNMSIEFETLMSGERDSWESNVTSRMLGYFFSDDLRGFKRKAEIRLKFHIYSMYNILSIRARWETVTHEQTISSVVHATKNYCPRPKVSIFLWIVGIWIQLWCVTINSLNKTRIAFFIFIFYFHYLCTILNCKSKKQICEFQLTESLGNCVVSNNARKMNTSSAIVFSWY